MFTQDKYLNDAKFFWNLTKVNDIIVLQNENRIKGKIVDKLQDDGAYNLVLEKDDQLVDVLIYNDVGTPWLGFAVYKKS